MVKNNKKCEEKLKFMKHNFIRGIIFIFYLNLNIQVNSVKILIVLFKNFSKV